MCKGNQKATTTSTNMPDPAAYALYQRLLSRAEGVSNTPYTPYGGDLVAPINAQQQLGIDAINATSPFFNQAMQLSSNIATPLTAAEIQQYQDPFTQSVVNATQNQFNVANEEARQKLMASAAAQKALGGNRIGVAEGELARQQQLAQAPVIAQLNSQGYNTGLNTALAMKELQSRGVQGMLSAGQGALGVAGAQLGAGTLQQQTDQALLDALYQQWQNQQAYPFQTTQWLANLGTGVGSQMGGTGTTTTPGPSKTSQILGGITTGIGLLGSMGFFQRGGRVKGLAVGGGVFPDNVIPESEETLQAQQDQLVRGDRAVQMFPAGTPELPAPVGAGRLENSRGVFHYDPEKVSAEGVAAASAAGRENELLDLGPYSKADIAKLVQLGSPLLAIVERAPDGTEVRAALGTPETVEAQVRAMEAAKSPENTISVQDFESILADRMGGGSGVPKANGLAVPPPSVEGLDALPEGRASGGKTEHPLLRKVGATPWSGATGVVPMPEFGMVRGPGAPNAPRPYSDSGGGKLGDLSGLGKALKGLFPGTSSSVAHTPGGFSEAFPAPGSSGGYRFGGVYVPVFASGGSVGLAPQTLQELYGIDEVPGLASGGVPFRIYENDELSPLDPPSGRARDMLVRGVLAEAGNQGPVGMQSVASVVRNRGALGGFGEGVEGILTKPYQFEPFNTPEGRARMERIDPNSPAYKEAEAAVDRAYTGDDPTSGATHFYAPKAQAALGRRPPAWDDGTGVDIGDHRFFGGANGNPVDAGRGVAVPVIATGYDGPVNSYSSERPRGGLRPVDNRVSLYDEEPEMEDYSQNLMPRRAPEKPGVDWSSEGKLWPSLIAAGLGMLASRSPFPGVAIGEGGLAGLNAYAQLRGGEQSQRMAEERLNLEAQRLRMAADIERRRLRADERAAQRAEWPYTRLTLEQKRRLLMDERKLEGDERRANFQLRVPQKIGTDARGREQYAIPMPSADGKQIEWWPYDPKTRQLAPEPLRTRSPLDRAFGEEGGTQPAGPGPQGAAPAPGIQKAKMTEEEAYAAAAPQEIRAQAPAGSKQARNEAYLQYLQQEIGGVDGKKYADLIKGIANYQINPNALFSLRGNTRQRALEDVLQYDPTYDQRRFAQTNRAISGWTQSPEGRATRALSVTVEHLMSLEELAKALHNGDVQALNAIRNKLKTQFGYEGPPNFNFAKKIVADEIAKAVIGGQTAQTDRQELQEQINAASSPAQLMGVINTAKELMAGQLVGLKHMYETATGLHNFDNFLTPNAQQEVGALMEERERKLEQRMRERGINADKRLQAIEWLKKNPNDPRAPAIRKKFEID